MFRCAARRVAVGLAMLLVTSYLCFLGQELAGPARLGTPPTQAALRETVRFWCALPAGQLGAGPEGLVGFALRSAGVLVAALAVAGVAGALLGTLSAARGPGASSAFVLLSTAGVATPSFCLAFVLQLLDVALDRHTGLSLLPPAGLAGGHLLLVALVLAARPAAQVARLTHARLVAVLGQDYVRTARGKGLSRRGVWAGHVAPNLVGTMLSSLEGSLGTCVSSLPVVEVILAWPGLGRALLDAWQTRDAPAAAALAVALGGLTVAGGLLLHLARQALDPGRDNGQRQRWLGASSREWLGSLAEEVWAVVLSWWRRAPVEAILSLRAAPRPGAPAPRGANPLAPRRRVRSRAWLDPALILGLAIAAALLLLAVAGPWLAPHDPQTTLTLVDVGGRKVLPPAPPSPVYPLGTDGQGRDVASLLLTGARRTLAIALVAVVVRLVAGGGLGFLAGWFPGSGLSRVIAGLAAAPALAPALVLAMLIVYALGPRPGAGALVLGLAAVGWGEVVQAVRAQVVAIRPAAYIEGAVATGLSEGQILRAHVLPGVWPLVISLGLVQLGGALVLLGELGTVGVAIGRGLLAEAGAGQLGVPEWSAMLAASWRGLRSFPWATLYPALAFALAGLGCTWLGEGLWRAGQRRRPQAERRPWPGA